MNGSFKVYRITEFGKELILSKSNNISPSTFAKYRNGATPKTTGVVLYESIGFNQTKQWQLLLNAVNELTDENRTRINQQIAELKTVINENKSKRQSLDDLITSKTTLEIDLKKSKEKITLNTNAIKTLETTKEKMSVELKTLSEIKTKQTAEQIKLNTEKEKVSKELETTQGEITKFREQVNTSETSLTEKQGTLTNLKQDLSNTINTLNANSVISGYINQKHSKQQTLSTEQSTLSTLQQEITTQKTKEQELLARIEQEQQEGQIKPETQSLLNTIRKQINDKQELINTKITLLQTLQNEISQIDLSIQQEYNNNESYTTLKQSIDTTNTQINTLQTQLQQYKQALSSHIEKEKVLNETITALNQILTNTNKVITNGETSIVKMRETISQVQNELDLLSNELIKQRATVGKLETQLKNFETEKTHLLGEYETSNRSLRTKQREYYALMNSLEKVQDDDIYRPIPYQHNNLEQRIDLDEQLLLNLYRADEGNMTTVYSSLFGNTAKLVNKRVIYSVPLMIEYEFKDTTGNVLYHYEPIKVNPINSVRNVLVYQEGINLTGCKRIKFPNTVVNETVKFNKQSTVGDYDCKGTLITKCLITNTNINARFISFLCDDDILTLSTLKPNGDVVYFNETETYEIEYTLVHYAQYNTKSLTYNESIDNPVTITTSYPIGDIVSKHERIPLNFWQAMQFVNFKHCNITHFTTKIDNSIQDKLVKIEPINVEHKYVDDSVVLGDRALEIIDSVQMPYTNRYSTNIELNTKNKRTIDGLIVSEFDTSGLTLTAVKRRVKVQSDGKVIPIGTAMERVTQEINNVNAESESVLNEKLLNDEQYQGNVNLNVEHTNTWNGNREPVQRSNSAFETLSNKVTEYMKYYKVRNKEIDTQKYTDIALLTHEEYESDILGEYVVFIDGISVFNADDVKVIDYVFSRAIGIQEYYTLLFNMDNGVYYQCNKSAVYKELISNDDLIKDYYLYIKNGLV